MIAWSFDVQKTAEETASGVDDLELLPIKDLALDPLTGDLALPPRLVSGLEAVAQRLWIRLNTWAGTWFLDQRVGVPYVTQILGVKAPNLRAIEALLRRVISGTVGVTGIDDFALSFNRGTRRLSCSFVARCTGGAVSVSTAFQGPLGVSDA